jgi:hypothetical protein
MKVSIGDHIYQGAPGIDDNDNILINLWEFEIIDISQKGAFEIKDNAGNSNWLSREEMCDYFENKETAILKSLVNILKGIYVTRSLLKGDSDKQNENVNFNVGDVVYSGGITSDYDPVMYMAAYKVVDKKDDTVTLRNGQIIETEFESEKDFYSYSVENEIIQATARFLDELPISYQRLEGSKEDDNE